MEEQGFGYIAEHLAAFQQNAITLASTPARSPLPVGTSKRGGYPDMPATATWPSWRDIPMTFIAQLNLADVAPHDTDQRLPHEGVLSFFYASQQPWGDKADDLGAAVVRHFTPEGGPLVPHPVPAIPDELEVSCNDAGMVCALSDAGWRHHFVLQQFALRFSHFISEPDSYDSLEMLMLELPEAEGDALFNFQCSDAFTDRWRDPSDQILGQAYRLQNDMRTDCADVFNPIRGTQARDWQLLLQLLDDGSGAFGFAMVYFWIHSDDLARHCFDNVLVGKQCD